MRSPASPARGACALLAIAGSNLRAASAALPFSAPPHDPAAFSYAGAALGAPGSARAGHTPLSSLQAREPTISPRATVLAAVLGRGMIGEFRLAQSVAKAAPECFFIGRTPPLDGVEAGWGARLDELAGPCGAVGLDAIARALPSTIQGYHAYAEARLALDVAGRTLAMAREADAGRPAESGHAAPSADQRARAARLWDAIHQGAGRMFAAEVAAARSAGASCDKLMTRRQRETAQRGGAEPESAAACMARLVLIEGDDSEFSDSAEATFSVAPGLVDARYERRVALAAAKSLAAWSDPE